MSLKSLGVGVVCALALGLPVWAHHSHGNYEKDFIDLRGTVTEIHLLNPHSWVYTEVTDENGKAAVWALETITPGGLARIGVTREYIKPGDAIKVRCHRARDGGNSCLLGFVQAPDGSIKDWDGHGAKPVDDGFFDID